MSAYMGCYECSRTCCGGCLGFTASFLPCLCCCCYLPYKRVGTNEVGLKKSFGRYKEACRPGLNYFNPCTEEIVLQNIQTNVLHVPRQKVFTKDNISLAIDTVCFYRVVDPYRASFIVNDLVGSIMQITYVTLRIICGEYVPEEIAQTLQQLLQGRTMLNEQIQKFVEKSAEEWGTCIERILVKDMILSPLLQQNMSIVSKTQRLCESRIISAKADLQSAKLYREAADIMDTKAAMQIRFLETLSETRKKAGNKLLILPLNPQEPLDM